MYPTVSMEITELGRCVIAPAAWSYNAVRIFADKFLHAQDEDSIVNALHRVAHFVANGDVELEDRIFDGLFHQRYAFNSPVFFNAGIEDAPQCSACFIQSVEDNMESILDLAVKEGLLFRYGSGSGTNLSPIRSSKSRLSGGGRPSGPVSFMRGYDAFAGVIKSGGKTRRAAKMQILDANHDDIKEFIWAKAKEERKARDLITKAGYDADFNGDAYSSIFFQNSNLSVRMLNSFEGRTTHDMEIMQEIAKAAWECGDPGVQFAHAINKMNPCDEEIVASNPCSEFLFLNETSCNLASLNLIKYLGEDDVFDHTRFAKDVRDLVIAMDNIVDLAGYPTPEIEEKTKKYRPLGIGFTNLAHLLASMDLEYDSATGRGMAAGITALMYVAALRESESLAGERGACEGWDETLGTNVVRMHLENIRRGQTMYGHVPKLQALWHYVTAWAPSISVTSGIWLRNSQLTAIAPTGTISFVMDAVTTGIEPPYARNITKKLAGGGEILTTQYGKNVRTASEISPKDHLLMVVACQPFVSGGISKTINMPNDATVDDILDIYTKAWVLDVKSITVYRDGCKLSQPLNDVEAQVTAPSGGGAVRQPLPSERPAITHRFSVGEHDGYVTVGMYDDGRPGEVFVQISKEGSTISGLLDAWAITTSIALQHGTPLKAILDKLAFTRFDPAGFTGNTDIPMAHSIVDYLARWLLLRFDSGKESTSNAPQQQLAGNACPDCGSMMIRTGTCYSCPACGNHGGCG